VPEGINHAILLHVSDLYTFRESVRSDRLVPIAGVVDRLMSGYSFKGVV